MTFQLERYHRALLPVVGIHPSATGMVKAENTEFTHLSYLAQPRVGDQVHHNTRLSMRFPALHLSPHSPHQGDNYRRHLT